MPPSTCWNVTKTVSTKLINIALKMMKLNCKPFPVGICVAAIAIPNALLANQSGDTGNQKRTSLHQEVEFNATPMRVYKALLSSKQFTEFTHMKAQIKDSEGGALMMFGGLVVGRNIELVPGQRIVQAWRPTSWAAGVYSVVKFTLEADGGKTKLILDHTGFPEGTFDGLTEGWKSHYWDPLKSYLQ